MADLGTFAGRLLPGTILQAAFTYTWGGEPEYNLGVFPGRQIGGGGGATYIDRNLYISAPPSTNGPGDWGMRFFAGRLGPVVVSPGGVEDKPDLYVCPAGSRAYVREFRLYNSTAAGQAVKIFFNGFPVFDGTLAPGTRYEEGGLWILGPGEVVEATGPASVADGPAVWAYLSGIEEVA